MSGRTVEPSSSDYPRFRPRLQSRASPAPFNPAWYYLIGLFSGGVGVGVIAVMNLPRMATVKGLAERTYAVLVVLALASIVFLVAAPDEWWDSSAGIRLGLRVISVLGGVALNSLHKGPAHGSRSPGFTSMWKAIGWIIAASLAQGFLTNIVRELVV